MWPITRFLYELTGATDRRSLAHRVVDRFAPTNRNRAFRRIHALLDDGVFDEALASRLEQAFPERTAGLREALAATDSQRGALGEGAARSRHRQYARFHPHLWVATQRERNTQLTIMAVMGGIDRWLKIRLPDDVAEQPWRQQQAWVRQAVRDHRRRDRYGGELPLFGPITGYWYRPRLESRFWVSVHGIVHNRNYGPFEEPRARLGARPPSLAG